MLDLQPDRVMAMGRAPGVREGEYRYRRWRFLFYRLPGRQDAPATIHMFAACREQERHATACCRAFRTGLAMALESQGRTFAPATAHEFCAAHGLIRLPITREDCETWRPPASYNATYHVEGLGRGTEASDVGSEPGS